MMVPDEYRLERVVAREEARVREPDGQREHEHRGEVSAQRRAILALAPHAPVVSRRGRARALPCPVG